MDSTIIPQWWNFELSAVGERIFNPFCCSSECFSGISILFHHVCKYIVNASFLSSSYCCYYCCFSFFIYHDDSSAIPILPAILLPIHCRLPSAVRLRFIVVCLAEFPQSESIWKFFGMQRHMCRVVQSANPHRHSIVLQRNNLYGRLPEVAICNSCGFYRFHSQYGIHRLHNRVSSHNNHGNIG